MRATVALAALVLVGAACGSDDGAGIAAPTTTEAGPTTTDTLPDPAAESSTAPTVPDPAAPTGVEVIARYPHDTDAFTQGLELIGAGTLVESTGQYGESDIRVVDVETGGVEMTDRLDDDLFGEGVTRVGGDLVQLTWRAGRAIVRDAATLAPTGTFAYTGEGWGICLLDDVLVMSDGTATLTLRDPDDFGVVDTVTVTRDGAPLDGLNELECVEGAVFANVFTTDDIVRIDPVDGAVTATVDASGLLSPDEADDADVLNGIAHDPADGTFLVTGKYWPWMFRVRLVA